MTAPLTDAELARLRAPFTDDELDTAYGAVFDHHPGLTGDRLHRKALRVAAILRHAHDPSR